MTMSPTGTWSRVAQQEKLKRSSLCASAVDNVVYVFGGELQPRQPRDNEVHKIVIAGKSTGACSNGSHNHGSVWPNVYFMSGSRQNAIINTALCSTEQPLARVGAATASLHGKIYMFSGRGGEAMAPIDEQGSLWVYDSQSSSWTLPPAQSKALPPPRSYHCMTSDGKDSIYVHAGCPESGRLSDLWVFSLHSHQWKQLTSAPDPPRGGASIAYADDKLYRMNGFDGKTEQGGSLDVYDVATDSWTSLSFPADGVKGPGARSVSALVKASVQGRTCLVTMFGERDPSALGHQGAGKMLEDLWLYSISDGEWSPITVDNGDAPPARGWFDADVVRIDGKDYVAVVGGLGESNERLDDVWLLEIV